MVVQITLQINGRRSDTRPRDRRRRRTLPNRRRHHLGHGRHGQRRGRKHANTPHPHLSYPPFWLTWEDGGGDSGIPVWSVRWGDRRPPPLLLKPKKRKKSSGRHPVFLLHCGHLPHEPGGNCNLTCRSEKDPGQLPIQPLPSLTTSAYGETSCVLEEGNKVNRTIGRGGNTRGK